jgi:hypothetical protein
VPTMGKEEGGRGMLQSRARVNNVGVCVVLTIDSLEFGRVDEGVTLPSSTTTGQ